MKIEEKISLLKKTINEIKNISVKLDNDYVYEKKIAELNEEISRLKNGIKDSVEELEDFIKEQNACCLLYTSPSPRDATLSRMPSSA